MFFTLIENRRSIRKFQDRAVEAEKVDTLVEAALRSPSSMSSNPWEFIVVQDRGLIEKLAGAKEHGSSFLKNAPLAFVVCADPDRSSVWIEDAAIASLYLHLAATALGLGSCWVQIRDRMHDQSRTAQSYVSELLHIPENLRVLSIIGMGYGDEAKPGHKKETLPFEKVYQNVYGNRRGA